MVNATYQLEKSYAVMEAPSVRQTQEGENKRSKGLGIIFIQLTAFCFGGVPYGFGAQDYQDRLRCRYELVSNRAAGESKPPQYLHEDAGIRWIGRSRDWRGCSVQLSGLGER